MLPVLLWSLGAVIVLTAAGVFISINGFGRIALFPPTPPTPTPEAVVDPVIDTSYSVLILNATGERGSATAAKDLLVASGWPPESVSGQAGSEFPTTTVYYALPEDEAAALGVAEVIGGGAVERSAGISRPTTPPRPTSTRAPSHS